MTVHYVGVLIGLALSIILISRKLSPVISLFLGAVVGALIGGINLAQALQYIISGSGSVMSVNVRVIAGGVLAGVLIESGAAETISRTIVKRLGEKHALMALALAGMIITVSGIFITVSIVMLAPIALSVAKQANISKGAVLMAVSGGTKAGNIASPNPNTVAIAEAFGLPTNEVMIGGIVPMIFGVIVSILLAGLIKRKGTMVQAEDISESSKENKQLPSFLKSITAPIVAIVLLMIGPFANLIGIGFLQDFELDVFFILPIAAVVGALVMGKGKHILQYANAGVTRMIPIVMILIGAGALGGIIINSNLPFQIQNLLDNAGISGLYLAPLSGSLMAAAAASTSTGAILATSSFAESILIYGIAPLTAAVTMHAGTLFIDVMPHGNIFLSSKEAYKLDLNERLKIMPFEILVGATLVIVAVVMFGFIFT
ncbi:MAG: SLC13 family permease [Lachnospiraceae bacterium]|nr:SLC13 family permease [Lachnospiraceae bacterium]